MNTSTASHTASPMQSPPLTETARTAAAEAGAAARDTATKVAESTAGYANAQKSAAADRVEAYGKAVEETARSLEHEDPNIAWLTHSAAQRLESAASYVRNRDFSKLRADAEELAGRHPALFFGGMCVAGLVLGSVIKASRAKGGDAASSNETGESAHAFNPESSSAGI